MQRIKCIVEMIFAELKALALVTLRYFFSPAKAEEAALETLIQQGGVATKHTPILLVHGFLHNGSGFYEMVTKLKKEGYEHLYVVDLEPHRLGFSLGSIEDDYSKVVRAKARQIQQAHGCDDLILIGHSMGGLVNAEYATQWAEEDGINVPKAIAMQTPAQGTVLAGMGVILSLGQSECAKEMKCGSDFLKGLNQRVKACVRTRFYNITSGSDPLVIPNENTAFVGQPEERIRYHPYQGHLQCLFSEEVFRDIVGILKEP